MAEWIVPPTLAVLLAACAPCLQARSSLTVSWLVLGWVQCQGRQTLTTGALAAGASGQRPSSVSHRFFRRAAWSLDARGHGVVKVALAWIPADQPLVVRGDATLARNRGTGIAVASLHHDPLV